MIPLLLSPIISMLANKGLDIASKAIEGGLDKGVEYIENKTGIKLDASKGLSQAEVEKISELEISHKIELEQLALENKKEDNRHDEVKHEKSHETYQVKSDMADTIAQQIISRNLPIIGLLVVINVALVYFLQDKASLIAIASNIIGVAIGNLFNERQAIVNFFFGSSLSSKDKDNHIKILTAKGK